LTRSSKGLNWIIDRRPDQLKVAVEFARRYPILAFFIGHNVRGVPQGNKRVTMVGGRLRETERRRSGEGTGRVNDSNTHKGQNEDMTGKVQYLKLPTHKPASIEGHTGKDINEKTAGHGGVPRVETGRAPRQLKVTNRLTGVAALEKTKIHPPKKELGPQTEEKLSLLFAPTVLSDAKSTPFSNFVTHFCFRQKAMDA